VHPRASPRASPWGAGSVPRGARALVGPAEPTYSIFAPTYTGFLSGGRTHNAARAPAASRGRQPFSKKSAYIGLPINPVGLFSSPLVIKRGYSGHPGLGRWAISNLVYNAEGKSRERQYSKLCLPCTAL
jgi:hypothetical protein